MMLSVQALGNKYSDRCLNINSKRKALGPHFLSEPTLCNIPTDSFPRKPIMWKSGTNYSCQRFQCISIQKVNSWEASNTRQSKEF